MIHNWSPLEIQLLLHCYACIGPWDNVSNGSPAHDEAISKFLVLGIVEPSSKADENQMLVGLSNSVYNCTDRGRALVTMLLNTPAPEARYIDPRTNKPVSDDLL